MPHNSYASLTGRDGATTRFGTQADEGTNSTTDGTRKTTVVSGTHEGTSSPLEITESRRNLDPGVWTYRACIFSLALMWLVGIGVIVYGSIVQRITDTSFDGYKPALPHHKALSPFLRLAISFVVTALSDLAGLIHSTSLRFTLMAAGKLTFNSNLRLLTNCPGKSHLHSWPANLAWAWSLISSYACGSMVLLQTVYKFEGDGYSNYSPDIVCGYSLIFLGFGLLGQASIATWALRVNKVFIWSTNPILIANICREQGYLTARPHRSMLSVHNAKEIETPAFPRSSQGPLLKAHSQVRRILIASWTVTLLSFLFFAAISIVYQVVDSPGPSWGSFSRSYTNDWSLIPNWRDYSAYLAIPTSLGHSYRTFGPWFLCKYIFTSTFIGAITLNLHIVELLVQTWRDETLWRKAASPTGIVPNKYSSIHTAITSWQTIGLFIFKTLLHWMFSLAFGLMWEGVELFIPQFLYTAVLLFLFSVAATCLALYRPKGPQPATFGHLQTLVDLIDVWPCGVEEKKGQDAVEADSETAVPRWSKLVRLYWGDKGEDGHGVRRAGTGAAPLNPIVFTARYL